MAPLSDKVLTLLMDRYCAKVPGAVADPMTFKELAEQLVYPLGPVD